MSIEANALYQQLRDKVASSPLSEVLPLLLMLAKELKHQELEQWARLELQGYSKTNSAFTKEVNVPTYREVTGLWHDALGRKLMIEVPQLSDTFNFYRLPYGVAELESLTTGSVHSVIDHFFPPQIRQHFDFEATHFDFHSGEVAGVLSEIRSRVIDWLSEIADQIPKQNTNNPAPPVSEVASATVFYSWQSDSPNKTNRGFIEECLKRALKELKAEEALQVEPCIDRDTKDVPGSPDIAATIFEKIESCSLFVCDVSIINKGASGRPTPNPNVLIELGFAVKSLGWHRVVCVFNEATGKIEDLPFDLRHRRVRCYRLEDGEEKAEVRKLLSRLLKSDIQSAFSFLKTGTMPSDEGPVIQPNPVPCIEVLDGKVQCQPPIARLPLGQVHLRPRYLEERLNWTFAASLFLDGRPGELLTVVRHRCEAWITGGDSEARMLLSDLTIQSDPSSQVLVDDAVLLIRGPGKLSFQGVCQTPFRNSGFPETLTVDIRLPVSELGDTQMQVTLELHNVHQGGGWPCLWKYRQQVEPSSCPLPASPAQES